MDPFLCTFQGGRGTEELERDRKLHSSTARGLQGTAVAGSRVRQEQMGLQGVPTATDYNSESTYSPFK